MPRNIEIKAKLNAVERLHELVRARSEREITIDQEDVFFYVSRGRLKLRKVDGRGELIFYERETEAGPKLSRYTVVPVAAPEPLEGLLAEALGVRAVVRKRRTVMMVGQTRVHLDEVEGLGSFMELEVVLTDGQDEHYGQGVARGLMEAFEIDEADLVECAYVDLLEARGSTT